MRLAVVGIGKMGMLHAGIMNALEGVELCALSDSSRFLLGFAKSLKDVPVYKNYEKMLDKEQPDIAVLATPVFLHAPMGIECAQRGISFFLEKPLSVRAEDSETMLKLVEEKNLTTMVGYMMRYIETFSKAKEIIDSGVLGKIINFNSTIYVAQLFKTGKGWRYDKEKAGGGVISGQGTHAIDLLHWYFGDVDFVSANMQSFYSENVEDFAHVYFKFANGTGGWLDSSWSKRHHRLLEVEINVEAENGNLTVNDDVVKFFWILQWVIILQAGLFCINRIFFPVLKSTLVGRSTRARMSILLTPFAINPRSAAMFVMRMKCSASWMQFTIQPRRTDNR